jgi:hypothetical protein
VVIRTAMGVAWAQHLGAVGESGVDPRAILRAHDLEHGYILGVPVILPIFWPLGCGISFTELPRRVRAVADAPGIRAGLRFVMEQ